MLMLDRRMLLRAGTAATGAAALAATTTVPALAHASQSGKQAQPSFYRFKLGTIEITVVSDGSVAFPAETLWGDRAEDAEDLLTSTFQPRSPVQLQLNTIGCRQIGSGRADRRAGVGHSSGLAQRVRAS
jgi:hypothetical protein